MSAEGVHAYTSMLTRIRPTRIANNDAGQRICVCWHVSCSYVLSCEVDPPDGPAGCGGHYPANMRLQGYDNSSSRTLVHWCHGAPGAVFLWCAAHEVRWVLSTICKLEPV